MTNEEKETQVKLLMEMRSIPEDEARRAVEELDTLNALLAKVSDSPFIESLTPTEHAASKLLAARIILAYPMASLVLPVDSLIGAIGGAMATTRYIIAHPEDELPDSLTTPTPDIPSAFQLDDIAKKLSELTPHGS